MAMIGIDHVQLAMPAGGDEAARRFYRDVLGLAEVGKPPQLAARGRLWFVVGGVSLHLGVEAHFRPATRAHPAFLVADLPALRARLDTAGVEIVEDDSGLPVDRCYVGDPFGNRIELVASADSGFSLRWA